MIVYVVTAQRIGESYKYVCGVFRNKEEAEISARREILWQGEKCVCMITELEMDYPYVAQNKKAQEQEWVRYEYSDELEKLNQIETDYVRDLSHTF